MEKTIKKKSTFEDFIKSNVVASEFNDLHNILKVSRKMLTMHLRHPQKLLGWEINLISKCTKIPSEEILKYCIRKKP